MNTFKIKMSLNSFFSILFGQLTMGNTCLYTIFFFCVCFWCVCVCGSVYVGVCGSLSRCGCKIVMNLRDIVKTDHFTSFLGLVYVCMYVCVCLCNIVWTGDFAGAMFKYIHIDIQVGKYVYK